MSTAANNALENGRLQAGNQIAQGFGPSVRAIERSQREGLSRHDALHAIGSVISSFSYEALAGQSSEEAATAQFAYETPRLSGLAPRSG